MAVITKSIGTSTHAAQTGTLDSASLGDSAIAGTSTLFSTEYTAGTDRLLVDHAVAGWHSYEISSVTDNTNLVLAGGLVEALSGGETPYKQGTVRHYSTISAWEADSYGATGSDSAVGEMYDDSAFDEDVTLSDSTPTSITLTVPEAERHDGTAGTGVRLCAGGTAKKFAMSTTENTTLEWMEWDNNNLVLSGITSCLLGNSSDRNLWNNLLVHDIKGNNWLTAIGVNGGTGQKSHVTNSIVYDIESTSVGGILVVGIELKYNSGGADEGGAYNCTVVNVIRDSGSQVATGIQNEGAGADAWNPQTVNCIAMNADDTDFTWATSFKSGDYNLSSDVTADDQEDTASSSIISKTASSQFVSTTGGSEDFHLKAGSDAIDVGTDLGTFVPGVEIDIDGRDRDAEGDTWDMGAHEYISVGGGLSIPVAMHHYMNNIGRG